MHKHTPAGITCRFATKKRCDENWTQFLHGHMGWPCVKQFQPTKSRSKAKDGTVRPKGSVGSIATCTIIKHPELGQSFSQTLAEQIAQAPQSWRDELEAWNDAHGGTLDAG